MLRSRFWLVQGWGATGGAAQGYSRQIGLNLMKHAHTEFKYLARFLPSLYIAENREQEEPPFPW